LIFLFRIVPSHWPTIPQVFIKGEFIGGSDIMLNLQQSGELRRLLINANLIKDETTSDEK
jgi:glutaredoxin-related protein